MKKALSIFTLTVLLLSLVAAPVSAADDTPEGVAVQGDRNRFVVHPRHGRESGYILGLGYRYLYHRQNYLDQTGRKLTAEACGMKGKTI